jgi:hypothetical protein
MNRSIVMVALAVALSGMGFSPAITAESTTDALLACADQPDDARRLRCFDAVVAELRTAPAAPPSAPSPVAPPQPSARAPAVSPEDKFGARGDVDPDKADELKEITATVTAIGAKPYGELVITLDNGQVWAERAPGSKIKLKTGDSVKIEAGELGSFRLIAPNGRSSKVARVR